MTNQFRLIYNKCTNNSSIILDKDINEITSEDLLNIGYHPNKFDKKQLNFTILKFENNGLINWKLINNTDKPIYINSKINSTIKNETLILKSEYYIFKDLLQEKIYYNKINSEWDFFSFDKFKIYKVSEKVYNPEDEPIDVDFNQITELFELCESNTKNLKKINSINFETEQNKFFLNDTNLKKLLEESIQISDEEIYFSKKFICENHTILEVNETKNETVKNKKIINDDEEEIKTNTNDKDDYVDIDEFQLAQILKKYEEEMKIENSPIIISEINEQDTKKNKSEHLNSASKYGAEFNSNDKRKRQFISTKEKDEFHSSYKTKRLKKATDNKELKIDFNTQCAICLENIKNLANLNCCSHDFCKECIIEWSSKYTNLCPLCKKEFKKIIFYVKNKKRELKVKKKKLEIEEDEIELQDVVEESSDECMKCGLTNDLPNMLICDCCHYNVCHTYCDQLSEIPETDWFCSECKEAFAHVNLIRDLYSENLTEEENDDEKKSPKIILENDDEDFILEENESVYQSSNRNNNIINIHVNFNMRERPMRNGRSRNSLNNNLGNVRSTSNRRIYTRNNASRHNRQNSLGRNY